MTEDKRNPRFTNEELEIEKICDEERYMFLNEETNEEDESNEGKFVKILKQIIEIIKENFDLDKLRSNKPYGSVKFDYNTNNQHQSDSNDQNDSQDDTSKINETPFIPTANLNLPTGMLTPETVKMNQIIVKTASFVVNQGLQMEILLKAKQAANSQFDFLNFDHYLNPYYKHIQNLIKTNQINPLEFLVEPSKSKHQLFWVYLILKKYKTLKNEK